ncbi:sugar isomerase domain-containing protein [Actinopolymorpha alba]|uniref:sugar isomerase domain-containing protein n=1 Tax=Actinopolymorpha alba TaxID=533267 RepID=UPI00037FAD66|nr:SIS domain-containing protein [Actinopolymorpha alba]
MTTPSANAFFAAATDVLTTAIATQRDVVVEAGRRIAATIDAGGKWWVFGTGHSHLLVEELWGRAGGMTDLHPILEPSLMLHEGLLKSSLLEQQSGLAEVLLQLYPMAPGDLLLAISNSGRNAVPVEVATLARERGVQVIALTSLAHSRSVTSRAPSGKRLFEVADLVIDNCGVPGDAVIEHSPHPVGATSTIVGAMLLQALSVEVIGELERRGRPASTLLSLNA